MIITSNSEDETKIVGERIGRLLKGGQVIELIGDVGSGKTTLTKSIAVGLGAKSTVSSPSFAICHQHDCRDGLTLMHYDFYRLKDVGIMANELTESINRLDTVTVIEWGGGVDDILPIDKITIKIKLLSEESRTIDISDNMEFSL